MFQRLRNSTGETSPNTAGWAALAVFALLVILMIASVKGGS